MRLQLVTVALNAETGEFPADPLAEVEGEVLSVVEHFFHHGGLPHLLLVVHHRPHLEEARAEGASRRKQPKPDPAGELAPADRSLYEKLRTWRRGRAETDGVPVYVLLNNRQLATISRTRPQRLGDLRKVEGIGEKKIERYGRDLLKLLEQERGAGTGQTLPTDPGRRG